MMQFPKAFNNKIAESLNGANGVNCLSASNSRGFAVRNSTSLESNIESVTTSAKF